MLNRFFSATALSVSLTSFSYSTALAQSGELPAGLALFIANEDYRALWDARGADDILAVTGSYEQAQFRVDQSTDVSAGAMRAALGDIGHRLDAEPLARLLIVYSGYVVHAGETAWLVGTEVSRPNVASIDANGVRLETLLALAGARQGTAVVAIADHGYRGTLGAGLTAGLPENFEVPQGISVLHGPVGPLTQALGQLAQPGRSVSAVAGDFAGVELDGFRPPFLSFVGMAPVADDGRAEAELAAWEQASQTGTIASYQAYLTDWPDGPHADTARAEIQRIQSSPERAEAALALTRDERRAIQRDLNLLGHNTRGIDGLFGPASRRAITAWQTNNRFEGTSFLSRDQIFLLAQQGARRAAQLEAEERRRREEQERRDRLYWRDTGSGNDEAGMRAYLERFPEGIFANIARDRLAQIEAQRAREEARRQDRADWRRAQQLNTSDSYHAYLRAHPRGEFARIARQRIEVLEADYRAQEEDFWDRTVSEDRIRGYHDYLQAYPNGRYRQAAQQRINELRADRQGARREREYWRQARDANTVAAYNAYLNEYPSGPHADEARRRIEDLRGPVQPNPQPGFDERAARRAERNLGLNPTVIGLIQTHLALSGFNPGRSDGQIDAQTREAIRGYQNRLGVPETGYLTGDLVAQMTVTGIFGQLNQN